MAGDKRLVGYVVWREERERGVEGGERTAEDVRRHLRGRLPEPMVPGVIVELSELPLGPNGKVDRGRLPAPEARSGRGGALEVPRGEVERAVAGVWKDVLGLEEVGREDNFFDLGGHSLLLVQVHARLQEAAARRRPHRRGPLPATRRVPRSRDWRRAPAGIPVAQARSATGASAAPRRWRDARPVAIVGMAGRFPGAGTSRSSGDNLRCGRRVAHLLHGRGAPWRSGSSPRCCRRPALREGARRPRRAWSCSTPRSSATPRARRRSWTRSTASSSSAPGRRSRRRATTRERVRGLDRRLRRQSASTPTSQQPVLATPRCSARRRRLQADDRQRQGLPAHARLLQAEPARAERHRPDRVLDVAGGGPPGLPGASSADECDMALAGGVSISVPQKGGYLLPGGRHPVAGRALPRVRRAGARARSRGAASGSWS